MAVWGGGSFYSAPTVKCHDHDSGPGAGFGGIGHTFPVSEPKRPRRSATAKECGRAGGGGKDVHRAVENIRKYMNMGYIENFSPRVKSRNVSTISRGGGKWWYFFEEF